VTRLRPAREQRAPYLQRVATRRLRDVRGRFRASGAARRVLLGLVPLILVVVAGALLGTLLDPHAGWDLTTVASFAAVLIAITAGILAAGALSFGYLRVTYGRPHPRLRALPLGLVVAAVTVGISRLSMLSPGYLYGVVAGVVFEPGLDEEHETRLSAIGLGGIIAISTLAWFGFQWIRPQPGAIDDLSFTTALISTIPAAFCLAGLTGTAIELLPVGFLPGGRIFKRHRIIWVVLFALSLFLLASATRVTPSNGLKSAIFFAIFAVISVAFRLYVIWGWRHRHHRTSARGFSGLARDFFALHPRGRAQVIVAAGEIGPEEIEIEPLPRADGNRFGTETSSRG